VTILQELYRRPARAYLRLVTGRRSKWAVLALGMLVLVAVSPLAGQLGSLESNSPQSFLPSGVASTRVLRYEEAHGRASSPAVVVYERRGGLRPSDRRAIQTARAVIARHRLAGTGRPTPLRVSTSGEAALFTVPIAASTPQKVLVRDVKTIRLLVRGTAVPATSSPSARLEVAVGGPAGSATDAVGAFAGINGRLLVVTVVVVAVLLLLTYRSPFLWLLPLVSVGLAAGWSEGVAYGLASSGFVVNGMTVGILTVLVFGAGTDYGLLLVARYREELRRHQDPHEAMAVALRRAGPAIAVSGLTVILALVCLTLARLNDVAALGPACAGGILCALAAQLVFLPALLLATGRRAFWPFVPRPGDGLPEEPGVFGRLGRSLLRRPRAVWGGLVVLLALCSIGLVSYRGGLSQQDGFTRPVGSVAAQRILDANFPAGSSAPAVVLVLPGGRLEAALAAARATPGVAGVTPPEKLGRARLFDAVLSADPVSPAAEHTLGVLRQRLHARAGDRVLVGGETATNVDLSRAAGRDRLVIIPVVCAVVLLMLGLLLRSLMAPVVLVASVLLSYVAALGITSVVFRLILSVAGFDPSVPIFGFVFLVALGVDYNVFLMTRVREEARRGAQVGVVRGLAVTGGVITSAGVVLAATFAVLGILPLVALAEVGFLVAFGVLVDTLLVRSALVPALAIDLGDRLWWPGRPGPARGRGGAWPLA